ncbi:MBL fold metallo-hydrolase [Nonlabens sp. Asnod3-H03]|uniref:MBL fold metallo-hydrolase n=1 Tax=Nonlabens sp. Asnod3-H03 TaxID=3160580 RepID=UPI0038648BD9
MKNLLSVFALLSILNAGAQDRFAKVQITSTEVSENTFMLTGAGGNIMIAIDKEKVVMIDDQFAPLSDKIKDAIKGITEYPITYLINTHHHGDHTGGNGNFNSKETTIVAHVNVKKRLIAEGKEENFIPEMTLEEELELQLPTQTCLLIHVHNAHTDGDTFIFFVQENVVHMGDVFFNAKYPYIDLKSGGSIDGYIAAQERVLSTINEETKIIPGHGTLASYEDLRDNIEMLVDIKENIASKIKKGVSKEDIIADTTITAAYDAKAYGDGFIDAERFRTTVYESITGL